ncbi:hypothetical protein ACIHFD_41940 [Nonomuraea sp. NPDC051941]|uniref:hypothetical protein n=1 Tax=Nonomuraea sp. NPDC051941 TaxID=3364373 RepID=UPI0037CAA74E
MTRAERVILRLMLLVVVALGVVAMHTLGHINGHADMPPAGTHFAMHAASSEAGIAAGEESHEGAGAGWVCLAILGTALTLLLFRLGVRDVLGASGLAGPSLRFWSRFLRAPPIRSLTRTVVLRI